VKVAVIGLGKIGLPLAVQVASKGHEVVGLDIDDATVATIGSGSAPFPGEPELEERLKAALAERSFRATRDAAVAVGDADVVLVVVPLIVDAERRPDFGPLDAATEALAPHLRSGALVSYETTLPIGTTRERFTPALELGSGFTAGRDLFVCHSPERVSSGRVFRDLRAYPKLVGAADARSAELAVAFYGSALEFDERPDLPRANGVWDLGSAEAAELAKLAETTYRDINIAYANELAMVAEQRSISIRPVIEACNSQPYSHIHEPGISVGGHCIPVYPHFLLAGAPSAVLPAAAREVNRAMPERHVDLLEDMVGGDLQGRVVVVLGLAYRSGVKEHAFSGAFDVVRELSRRGAVAKVHDPLYDDAELTALGLEPHRLGDRVDGVILHTLHDRYRSLDALDMPGTPPVVDGRGGLTEPMTWAAEVRRLGG